MRKHKVCENCKLDVSNSISIDKKRIITQEILNLINKKILYRHFNLRDRYS